MCQRLVEEQQKMKEHPDVKFVQFKDGSLMFSVCLTFGEFIDYIKSYERLLVELDR